MKKRVIHDTVPEKSALRRRASEALHKLGVLRNETGDLASLIEELAQHQTEFERLSLVARNTSNIVIFTDAQRKIMWVNEAFTKISGYSADEALGRTPSFLQGPETDRETLDRIHAALEAGHGFREELINYTKGGAPFWIELLVQPLHDDDGNLTGFFSIQNDVTSRRQREEQLTNFGTAVEQTDNAIIITGLDGKIEYVNPGFTRITGYTREEALGRTLRMLASGEQDEKLHRDLWKHMNSGRPWRGVFRNKRKDGSLYWESATLTPVQDADGRVRRYISVNEDITARREAELARTHEHQQLVDLLNAATAVGVVGTDDRGVITLFNQGAEKMLGYSAAEVVGRCRPSIFHHPEELAAVQRELEARGHPADEEAVLMEVISQTGSDGRNWKHVRKDGSTLVVSLRVNCRHDGGYIGVLIDVTEKEVAAERLAQREQLLERAEELAKVGGWEVRLGGLMPTWSDECCRIHEVPVGTVPSIEEALNFYPEPGRTQIRILFERCAKEGLPYDLELPFVTAKGNRRWVHVNGRAMLRDGKPHVLSGAIQDITDRKEAERMVEAEERQLRSFCDLAPLGIVVNDAETGLFVNWNPAFLQMTGYSADELSRLRYIDITPREYWEQEKLDHPDFLRRGRYGPYEKEYIRKDGSRFPVLLDGVIIDSPQGRRVVWSFVQDMTTRKQMEQELRQARDRAEAANEAKSLFLANMSHEIRTPLNAILGMSELLLLEPRGDETPDLLKIIRSSGQALLALINDILDFSKIEADQLQLERTPVLLADIVASVCDITKAQAAEKDIKVVTELATDLPAMVWGDPTRLRQILLNFAGNAVKFTESGTVRIVAVKAERPGWLRLAVQDTGIGIDGANLDKLFKSFSQVDSSTTRRFGGTGLGLAIARRLVERMGGKVGVQSQPDAGSEFWAEIPFEEVNTPAPASARADGRGPAPCDLRILVVEDSDQSRRLMEAMLRAAGCRPDVVRGGQQALEALQHKVYDVVLTDVQMPGMDGIEMTREIRRVHGERGPRIVAVTAAAMTGDRERCLASGMDGYLGKPIQFDDLKQALREHTSAHIS